MTAYRREDRVDVGALRDRVAAMTGAHSSEVRVVRAPYRFCPLGAHVDHQGGPVTGVALDRATHLAYVGSEDLRVRLRSDDASGLVDFALDAVPDAIAGDWGNYVRGAARALGAERPLSRGLSGIVAGEMSPGGVSSSAALGVACLLALEDVNGLDVSVVENVELDRRIENDYLGLANGILDPSIILRAVEGALVHLDCGTGAFEVVRSPVANDLALVAVYSGITVALAGTGYNRRVAECRDAAAALLAMGGDLGPASGAGTVAGHASDASSAPTLGDVPRAHFDAHGNALPDPLRKRATHYFGEVERVRLGVEAWRRGDLAELGRLVTATGESSVTHYECGSPELTALFRQLVETDGVIGARFSGAGFRGYAMALVRPADAEAIGECAASAFAEAHPDLAPRVHWMVCRSARAAGLVDDAGRALS